ncbi:MAG: hypothetical protein NTY13_01765 [Chlamydiae bacterium]|nr:hypothetical protein [Chlamydiota bacterium]
MKINIFILLGVLIGAPLFAMKLPVSTLELELGGRFDQVHFDFEDAALGAKYNFDDISSWGCGLRARWDLSTYWYLRGNITYGDIMSGTSKINSVADYPLQTGDLKGHMLDIQAALGRFFCFTDWLAIAPIFGWGYDGQYIWTKSMASKNSFKEMQNGPFLGVDLHTQWTDCFSLDLGYEIHFTSSRTHLIPQGNFSELSPIRGHSKVTYGQVGWIEGLYRFSRHWQVGLRGEVISYSTTKSGRIIPGNQDNIYVQARNNEISWQSAQLSALLGYIF